MSTLLSVLDSNSLYSILVLLLLTSSLLFYTSLLFSLLFTSLYFCLILHCLSCLPVMSFLLYCFYLSCLLSLSLLSSVYSHSSISSIFLSRLCLVFLLFYHISCAVNSLYYSYSETFLNLTSNVRNTLRLYSQCYIELSWDYNLI